MSDEPAVYWSNYEQFREQASYDTRYKIADQVQETIDRCIERGLNNHFIAGLELAKGIVLGLTKDGEETPVKLNTDTLF
jgi:hypothetical protein